MKETKSNKQHFIPKVYLKYFSPAGDGKQIYLLQLKSGGPKTVKQLDSGNSIFKERKYYNSPLFEDSYALEKYMANEIENNYDHLIALISKEGEDLDQKSKVRLIQWLFFSKYRSPKIRSRFLAEFRGVDETKSRELSHIVKEAHLKVFTDVELFNEKINQLAAELASMEWRFLKTTIADPFVCSDSPGYCYSNTGWFNQKPLKASPFFDHVNADTVFFFPLTSTYGVRIMAFPLGTAKDVNQWNSNVNWDNLHSLEVGRLNFFTVETADKIVMARNASFLEQIAEMLNYNVFKM